MDNEAYLKLFALPLAEASASQLTVPLEAIAKAALSASQALSSSAHAGNIKAARKLFELLKAHEQLLADAGHDCTETRDQALTLCRAVDDILTALRELSAPKDVDQWAHRHFASAKAREFVKTTFERMHLEPSSLAERWPNQRAGVAAEVARHEPEFHANLMAMLEDAVRRTPDPRKVAADYKGAIGLALRSSRKLHARINSITGRYVALIVQLEEAVNATDDQAEKQRLRAKIIYIAAMALVLIGPVSAAAGVYYGAISLLTGFGIGGGGLIGGRYLQKGAEEVTAVAKDLQKTSEKLTELLSHVKADQAMWGQVSATFCTLWSSVNQQSDLTQSIKATPEQLCALEGHLNALKNNLNAHCDAAQKFQKRLQDTQFAWVIANKHSAEMQLERYRLNADFANRKLSDPLAALNFTLPLGVVWPLVDVLRAVGRFAGGRKLSKSDCISLGMKLLTSAAARAPLAAPDRAEAERAEQEIQNDPFMFPSAVASLAVYAQNPKEAEAQLAQEAFQCTVEHCTVNRATASPTSVMVGTYDTGGAKVIFVAVPGSYALDHWLDNADALSAEVSVGNTTVHVHRGMRRRAEALWQCVMPMLLGLVARDPIGTLVFCGHSLGAGCAAILLLCAHNDKRFARLVCKAYLFSTPACVTGDLPDVVKSKIVSVIFGHDLVPTLSLHAVQKLCGGQGEKHARLLPAGGAVYHLRSKRDETHAPVVPVRTTPESFAELRFHMFDSIYHHNLTCIVDALRPLCTLPAVAPTAALSAQAAEPEPMAS